MIEPRDRAGGLQRDQPPLPVLGALRREDADTSTGVGPWAGNPTISDIGSSRRARSAQTRTVIARFILVGRRALAWTDRSRIAGVRLA